MPATYAQIGQALRSDKFTRGEKSLIKWQFQMHGDFMLAIWKAISHSDLENLDRMSLCFPDEVAAFRSWAHGDLGRRIREFGLSI